jgi:MoxR-like ATPase
MREKVRLLKTNVEKVFVGAPQVTEALLVGVLAAGHVLIEDVPGVGKTVLARSLAQSIAAKFARIQFTPDLLPTDILGVSVLDQACGQFVFKPGPIFANVILADEINRATPRTQSALLEAMNELSVSADGQTYPLPSPFIIIATQNPFEFEGTFHLPEGQLDRFMLRLRVGYPDAAQEKEILSHGRLYHRADEIAPVLEPQDILAMQEEVAAVKVDTSIADYIVAMAEATRRSDAVELGVSPRGSLMLLRASQGRAYIEARDYVTPDDVKRMAIPVLAHRVILKGGIAGTRADLAGRAVESIILTVPVPA